jgi:hypothetical protein
MGFQFCNMLDFQISNMLLYYAIPTVVGVKLFVSFAQGFGSLEAYLNDLMTHGKVQS